MKLVMLLTMFLMIGAMFIIGDNNLYLGKNNGLQIFRQEYSNWLRGFSFDVKSVSSYVIKLDWLPDSS